MATKRNVSLDEARRSGCKFYIGTICSVNKEHGGVRYTLSNNCVECTRARGLKNSPKQAAKKKEQRKALKSSNTAFRHRTFVLGDPNWQRGPV